MINIYGYIGVTTVAIGLLTGAFFYGEHTGSVSERVEWQSKQLKLHVQIQEKVNNINRLRSERDVALAEADAVQAQVVTKEVVKYVTQYRDKIKNVANGNCLNESGLFDIINASMPTTASTRGPSIGSVNKATVVTKVHNGRNGGSSGAGARKNSN